VNLTHLALFACYGLGTGALIAGLALALVINYRGSGVINLAMGTVALLGAYEFFALRTKGDFWVPLPAVPLVDLGSPWSFVPAFVLALLASAGLGALFDRLVLWPLRNSAPLAKLVASLGLLLTIQALAIQRFGIYGDAAPNVLPAGPGDVVHIFGGIVPTDRLWLVVIVLGLTVVLMAVYKRTRFGIATRAAAENQPAAALTGLAPQSISMTNTMAAFALAGLLGILVAPTSQLDPTTIPYAVIPALGAALIARFTSFGVAAAVGIFFGILQSELIYLQTKSWFPTSGGVTLPGVADLLYFLIIVVVLVFQGKGLPERGMLTEARLPRAPAARRILWPSLVAAAVCGVSFFVLPFDWRSSIILTLIGAIVCLSLVVITGFVGQVSLFQVGLGGIAGLVVAKLALNHGIGFPLGAILGVLFATAFGVLVALPAFRVRGVSLAILTVAGMVAIEQFGLDNSTWGVGSASGVIVPEPKLFGIDIGPNASWLGGGYGQPTPAFALIVLVVMVALGIFVAALRRSILGQRMLAVRSNERAAAAAGIGPRSVKMTAFTVSSFIGAVAGVLYAYALSSVSIQQFGTTTALTFVAFAYLGGITIVRGALVGALLAPGALAALVMSKLNISPVYLLIIGGLGLIIAVVSAPEGVILTPLSKQPPVLLYHAVARRVRSRSASSPALANAEETA
jgi:branched-chain amino acid transport system permease protein